MEKHKELLEAGVELKLNGSKGGEGGGPGSRERWATDDGGDTEKCYSNFFVKCD